MERPSDRDWMMRIATKLWHVAAAVGSFLGTSSLVIVAAIVVTVAALVIKNETIALPLAVPEMLEKRGIRSDVLIERLQDNMEEMRLQVKEKHTKYRGPWDNVARLSRPDEFDISIPSMGTTLSTLVMKVRLMLPLPYRIIKGEVMCGDDKCDKVEQLKFDLRIIQSEGRFMAGRGKKNPLTPANGKTIETDGKMVAIDGTTYIEGCLQEASELLLSHLNPVLYAAYIYGQDESRIDALNERQIVTLNELPNCIQDNRQISTQDNSVQDNRQIGAQDKRARRANALRVAETSIAAKPDKQEQARDFKDLGRMLLDEGAPREAIVALTRAQELNKRDHETLAALAEAHHVLGHQRRALAAYDEAIRLYEIGEGDFTSRLVNNTQAWWDWATKEPVSPPPLDEERDVAGWGWLLGESPPPDEKGPAIPWNWLTHEQVWLTRQPPQSDRHTVTASIKAETLAKYYENRGLIAYADQNFTKAIADFTTAAQLSPSAATDIHVGYALLELNAYEAARRAFTDARGKALATSASVFPALFARGIAYFHHQEYLLAEQTFKEAEEFDNNKNNAKIWMTLSSTIYNPEHRRCDQDSPCAQTDSPCKDITNKHCTWSDALVSYLTGSINEAKLFTWAQKERPEKETLLEAKPGEDLRISTAEDGPTTEVRGQLAEAYFYVGAIHMANNEKAAAATCFRLSMNAGASGSQDFREVRMAQHMADLLGAQSETQPCVGEPAAVTLARGG